MENEKVKYLVNIINNMSLKDKLRLGICLSTSNWSNILYNKTEMYDKVILYLSSNIKANSDTSCLRVYLS